MYYLVAELSDKLKVYGHSKEKSICFKQMEKLSARTPEHVRPRYQVLDEHQLSKIKLRYSERATENRKKGALKAKAKAAGRIAKGLPPKKFILCPTCQAKSKLLFSEMGGLQTRTCRNGHHFEIDTYGGLNIARRVERTDRPLFVMKSDGSAGNYVDYILGRYKDDPEGKQDR